MATISVGEAVGAGFALIRRRPVSVISWGLPPLLVQIAVFAVLGPFYVKLISSGALLTPSAQASLAPQMLQMQATVQLLNLLQVFIAAVIYCAVWRALLHPERSAWGYLRLSTPELLLGVLSVAAFIAFFVALVVVMIPVVILVVIVGGLSQNPLAATVTAMAAAGAILLGLALFVLPRFAFVGPMIVEDGRFHLMELWRLTRGQVGRLVLIAVGVFGILLAMETVILIVLAAIGMAVVAATGGLSHLATLFRQPPTQVVAQLTPFASAYFVLLVPLTGVANAIAVAPWARAYQDVRHEASEAFA